MLFDRVHDFRESANLDFLEFRSETFTEREKTTAEHDQQRAIIVY
jgi:hypothetical protein